MPTHISLRGVIFDLDGTLADTLPVIFVAFRRAFQKHAARHFTDAEIEALFGPNEIGAIQRIVPDEWEACYNTFMQEYEAAHGLSASPFSDIVDLLDFLKSRGVRIAVVTGKGDETTAFTLRFIGLDKYFDIVETGSAQGAIKPQAIQKIVNLWGFPPNEVAYIGDAPTDITAARQAGVTPLAAAWADRADVAGLEAMAPTAVFRSVADLAVWLEDNVT